MSTNYLRHLSSKGRSSFLSPWVWARLSNLLLANRTCQKWWWCVTSRLYAKKHCSFSSLLSVKFLALRQARPHVVKMLQQPCGCRHGKELKPPANSQHEQTALWVSISEVGPPSSQARDLDCNLTGDHKPKQPSRAAREFLTHRDMWGDVCALQF